MDEFYGPPSPLASLRSNFFDLLGRDPQRRRKFMGLAYNEVGDQGDDALLKFIEGHSSRAGIRGGDQMSLARLGGYYPSMGNPDRVPGQFRQRFEELLPQAASGSNTANYATGNASGTVGFAGGPETARAQDGYERYGLEGPDRRKMEAIAGGDIEAIPAAASLTSGTIPSSLGQRPMPEFRQPQSLADLGSVMGGGGAADNIMRYLAGALQGGNLGQSIGRGLGNVYEGRQSDRKMDLAERELAQRKELGQLTEDIKEFNFGNKNPAFDEWLKKRLADQERFGLNAVPTVDEQGQYTLNQLSNRGGMRPVPLAPGQRPAPNVKMLDAGDHWQVIGPGGVQVVPKTQGAGPPAVDATQPIPGQTPPTPAPAQAPVGIPKNQTASEAMKGLGDWSAKNFGKIQDDASAALSSKNTIAAMRRASPEAYAGKAAPLLQSARSFLTSFGIPSNAVRAGEELQMLTSRGTLDTVGGHLGAGFSNADREAVERTWATLSDSEPGRQAKLEILEKMADRKVQIAAEAAKYFHANRGDMSGFNQHISKWAAERPMFAEKKERPSLDKFFR